MCSQFCDVVDSLGLYWRWRLGVWGGLFEWGIALVAAEIPSGKKPGACQTLGSWVLDPVASKPEALDAAKKGAAGS